MEDDFFDFVSSNSNISKGRKFNFKKYKAEKSSVNQKSPIKNVQNRNQFEVRENETNLHSNVNNIHKDLNQKSLSSKCTFRKTGDVASASSVNKNVCSEEDSNFSSIFAEIKSQKKIEVNKTTSSLTSPNNGLQRKKDFINHCFSPEKPKYPSLLNSHSSVVNSFSSSNDLFSSKSKFVFKKKEPESSTVTLDTSFSPSKLIPSNETFNLPGLKTNSEFHETSQSSKPKFLFKKKEASLNTTNISLSTSKSNVSKLLNNTLPNTPHNNEIPETSKLDLKEKESKLGMLSSIKKTQQLSLSIKKDNVERKNEGSPSLLSGTSKLTSKGTFKISKYFNSVQKDADKNSDLTPFKNNSKSDINDTEYKNRIINSTTVSPFKNEKESIKSALNRSAPITVSDTSMSSPDSPVIKPKKFTFKKKPLSSSSSTLSLFSQKSDFSKGSNENEKSLGFSKEFSKEYVSSSSDFVLPVTRKMIPSSDLTLSTNKRIENISGKIKDNIESDLCSIFGIQDDSKSESKDEELLGQTRTENVSTFKESPSLNESLGITEDDYMDDEEFERRFGNLPELFENSTVVNTSKENQNNMFAPKASDSCKNKEVDQDTEELLSELSNINWEEETFEEESMPSGFKDRNDDSAEFRGYYEYSEVMFEVLHQKFGLRSFRPHQREIINASLKQHDCFVLMPTGGGKSLCYQLPAVLMPGVTVVISPLRALISDQVDKLNALDIGAAHLCSDLTQKEVQEVYMKLSTREPTIKLLYLTPEKIGNSRAVIDQLDGLFQRGKLARFVIDEVHCLSQWGHDFRPDYKQLSMLRKKYKDVPIICLTATATRQVENDVIHILGLKNVKRFIRSFNRPNIKYQVLPKRGKKESTEQISELIKTKFNKKSGIVYCLSRDDCDTLAEGLNTLGIKSKPYHAGMKDKVREVIQREWMQDRFHVIVATIAFGMGIDKPDVRFVIHNSVPKSVEAFYQESGRAGRDGEISYSFLFYSYNDVARLQRLMQKERSISKKTFDAHMENLKQMVSFAENVVDCRRYLQLIHLGEYFDRSICIKNKDTTCDNCQNMNNYTNLNITKQAKELCSLLKDITARENITMLQLAEVYKGAKTKKVLTRGFDKLPHYGAGAQMNRNDLQRALKDLILKGIFEEHCMYTGDFPVVYIKPGKKFFQFLNSNHQLNIPVTTEKKVIADKAVTKPVIVTAAQKQQQTAKLQTARKLQLIKLKVKCHEDLLEECRRLAMERNLTLSSIMNLTAIKNMSDVLPNTKEEMLKIQHVTVANYSKYGEYFLKITQKYREEHDALLPLATNPKPKPEESIEHFSSDDDYEQPAFASSSQKDYSKTKQGFKRKRASWGGKKSGFKRKRAGTKGKGSSPKKKTGSGSGWKGKTTKSKGEGGLGLMPVMHFK